MKTNIQLITTTLGLAMLLSQCTKTVPELSGTASVADFTFAQIGQSDTLPFAYRVQFTNQSTDEFLYQWDFGDNSTLSAAPNPMHVYSSGGSYNVKFTTVGTNGNNSVTKTVAVAGACDNAFFNSLTNCNTRDWTWSFDGDAIKVLSPDATQVFFAGAAADCQVDDVYRFSANGTMVYDANGATFDVQSGYSCQAPKSNASSFRVIARAGERPVIMLGATTSGVGRPFIGTTDLVVNDQYIVMSSSDDNMVLRGVIEGSGGQLLEIKLRRQVSLTLDDIKTLLTGAAGKTWGFDGTPGANSIIVGTEGNPAEFFGGGPLADCQLDDRYTFMPANTLTYNANGATFNGGNIDPAFNCGADRSYAGNAYSFGPVAGGRAGLATIQLSGAVPARFIGVTDVPDNTYRIIEISPSRMVLRAGNGSGTVFQFKMVAF